MIACAPLNLAEMFDSFEQGLYAPRRGAVDGGTFAYVVPAHVRAVWGDGANVLASEGEGTLVVGGQGVGKTRMAMHYMLRRVGLITDPLAGLPVMQLPEDRKAVYLAMDRPVQAARMLHSIAHAHGIDRDALADRIVVWRGPVAFKPNEPWLLAQWLCAEYGDPGLVVVDSYKDLASNLSNEDVGFALNQAAQECLLEDIEWFGLHHNRKAGQGNTDPRALADVYGSTWLTSGLGSVIGLCGEAGTAMPTLVHLKQPEEIVGPLSLIYDHDAGKIGTLDGRIPGGPKTRPRRATLRAKFITAGPTAQLALADLKPSFPDISDDTLAKDLAALVDAGILDTNQPVGNAARIWWHRPPLAEP
jgi:hypothetical protein